MGGVIQMGFRVRLSAARRSPLGGARQAAAATWRLVGGFLVSLQGGWRKHVSQGRRGQEVDAADGRRQAAGG